MKTAAKPSPAPPPPERSLKVGDVMERTGYGYQKVYDLIRSGELRSFKDGKYRRVLESDLNAFLRARAEAGAA